MTTTTITDQCSLPPHLETSELTLQPRTTISTMATWEELSTTEASPGTVIQPAEVLVQDHMPQTVMDVAFIRTSMMDIVDAMMATTAMTAEAVTHIGLHTTLEFVTEPVMATATEPNPATVMTVT